MEQIRKVILSRTDALGDVMLTLPVAGLIKKYRPDWEILFLARNYARPLVERCHHIDHFIDRDDVAKHPQVLQDLGAQAIVHISPDHVMATLAQQARIGLRIGTSHRSFHWLRCNALVNLGRRRSPEHETQLNARLLEPLGITHALTLQEVPGLYGFTSQCSGRQPGSRLKIIFHPKSAGSAREWPLDHYLQLARLLPASQFEIYISGLAAEGELMRAQAPELFTLPHVKDITGHYTLTEFIDFIDIAHALVAASTGPLHIAAALGKRVLGLYPPIKPMDPDRWAPLGTHAGFLVRDIKCDDCRRSNQCPCMAFILPQDAAAVIAEWAD